MGINIGTTGVDEIYIGEGMDNYEAMRGPCPEGFHVPLTSESTTLVTALSDLGMDTSNGADISQYLKIPYAGYRYYTNGNISQQGVAGGYWASDGYSDSNYKLGNCVLFTSSVLYANNNQYRTLGLPVRPFRDTPVIPDSGWTQLYAGTGNSGVFHNSTLGLISISSDGTNWITIADKNLGATTVYNNGDTLSESNCGGYFQRGNNYMFPFTGNITTTYGYVDATNYGPGNYYSDSTFIKSTISTYDWCYPHNNNLRGRTTGITKKGNVIEVYVGTTKIRPSTTPPAEFTDWDSNTYDYVVAALVDTNYDIDTTINLLFGQSFRDSVDTATGGNLTYWAYDKLMITARTSWNGFQITNGGDMTDEYILSEAVATSKSICIVRDNDNLSDAQYLVGTANQSGFDFQLSSLASHFSGKDTVCMFIFGD